jgi:hypothetical protein
MRTGEQAREHVGNGVLPTEQGLPPPSLKLIGRINIR